MKKRATTIIVDDSAMYRDLLRQCLGADARVELVSQASSGKLAIPRVRYYQPDFVILDQEMPDLTGLEALKLIREISPATRVLMFCSPSIEGAGLALRALQEGATDFIAKPDGTSAEAISEYIRIHVVAKIVELSLERSDAAAPGAALPAAAPGAASRPARRRSVLPATLCAIGISTGGPVALRRLLSQLPDGMAGSLLIVQHMPPVFTAQLANSLQAVSKLKVTEALDGDILESGHVYIAPGGRQMLLKQKGAANVIAITDDPPVDACKPSVNVLFSSIAKLPAAKETIAVIMTGMGNDGTRGLRELKAAGAFVAAQNRESCVVFGMPSAPIAEGIADEVGDVDQIARCIASALSPGGFIAKRG